MKEFALGRSEESDGILRSQYSKIDFLDKSLSIGPYLYPDKVNIARSSAPKLLNPFGCNASQKAAVTEAFANQISVIQGPPGTGKTQTILNIVANIVLMDKTVMVVSNNNSATANVREKLQKYGLDFIVATLGSLENKEAFVNAMPPVPENIGDWSLGVEECFRKRRRAVDVQKRLDGIFSRQERLSCLRQELQSLQLEREHFLQEHKGSDLEFTGISVKSGSLMSWWLKCQKTADWVGIASAQRKIFMYGVWQSRCGVSLSYAAVGGRYFISDGGGASLRKAFVDTSRFSDIQSCYKGSASGN